MIVRTVHAALAAGASALFVMGCTEHHSGSNQARRLDVRPTTQPSEFAALELDASTVEPMYQELLPVDLPTVMAVVAADNLAIRLARQEVEAAKGKEESAIGGAFPALAPTASFQRVDGRNLNSDGRLFNVGFAAFHPAVIAEWVVNPGRVAYEIIAARKRFHAAQQIEQATIQETLRASAHQYYELALSQARVSAARQAISEAEELLRINRLRRQAGTGVLADELRAQARLAERQQDLVLALQTFYDASVALAVTLRLEATVTLVPDAERLTPQRLVRDDLPIEALLLAAVEQRPDLAGVRTIVEAFTADKDAMWWASFGPQFQVGYQYGGMMSHANNVRNREGIPGSLALNPFSPTGSFVPNPLADGAIREGIIRGSDRLAGAGDTTFGFRDRSEFRAELGWRLTLAAIGDMKVARAEQAQAALRAEQQLDRVRAEVVLAHQTSQANEKIIGVAQQQVDTASEVLRLSQSNLEAGTMTTLDVLQAQDAVAQARLRYAEAVVRYNQSQISLLASLGLLNEESLGVPRPVGAEP